MTHFRLTCVAHQPRPQAFLLRKGEGRCHSDMGIPIPKTLVILASPSRITLAIWVRVITRVLGMGMPISLRQRKGKGPGEEVGACEGRQEGENGFLSHIFFPLSLATRHLSLAFRAHLYAG